MGIVDVVTCPVSIPYRKPWVISGGPTTVAANVVVTVVDDSGLIGVGEASPVPAYSYETQASVLHVIDKYLRSALLKQDPFDLEKLSQRIETAIHGNHFAKAAVDVALHDLRAKILQVPVCSLLGGSYRDEIPLVFGIGVGSTEERVAEAVQAVDDGFREIKLKIGTDPNVDLEQVGAVRQAIGASVKIRVDANQGYRLSEAIPYLKKLERFDLQYIEQPLPRWDIVGMAKLAETLDTPIMADESAVTPQDVMTLIRHQAVDIVNIKIMKSGLTGAQKIAAIAEAAGIPCMVGSMVELGIGTAAGIHFACSTRNVTYACELIGPAFLEDDIVQGSPFSTWTSTHSWSIPPGPGLGVRLRPDIEEKLAHRGNDSRL